MISTLYNILLLYYIYIFIRFGGNTRVVRSLAFLKIIIFFFKLRLLKEKKENCKMPPFRTILRGYPHNVVITCNLLITDVLSIIDFKGVYV